MSLLAGWGSWVGGGLFVGIGWGFVKKWVVFGVGVGEFCFGNVVFGAWGWGWKGWLFCCWMGVNLRIVSGLWVVVG